MQRRTLLQQMSDKSLPHPFTEEEISTALQKTKPATAAGYDNIHMELLKNLGPKALTWLSKFFSRIMTTHSIPKIWRKAASRRHNDVILLPVIRRVSGNDFMFQHDSASHTTQRTCNSWTAASRNAKLFCAQPVASKQPRSQSCGLRDLGCHAASWLPQTNP